VANFGYKTNKIPLLDAEFQSHAVTYTYTRWSRFNAFLSVGFESWCLQIAMQFAPSRTRRVVGRGG